MKNKPSDRTGVFLVRLWSEVNQETGLRARITQTIDTMVPERSVAVAATADDICAVVKDWVEDFTNLSSSDGNDRVRVRSDDGRS